VSGDEEGGAPVLGSSKTFTATFTPSACSSLCARCAERAGRGDAGGQDTPQRAGTLTSAMTAR